MPLDRRSLDPIVIDCLFHEQRISETVVFLHQFADFGLLDKSDVI
jgi:hypothetical protein